MQYKVTCWIFSFCKWTASPLLSNLEAVEKYKQRSLSYLLLLAKLSSWRWVGTAALDFESSAFKDWTDVANAELAPIKEHLWTCLYLYFIEISYLTWQRARMKKILQPCLCNAAWALIQVLLHGRRNRGEYYLSSMFAEKVVNQGLSLWSSGLVSISHIR